MPDALPQSRELVETALHVLVAWTSWRKPSAVDVAVLTSAFPAWNHLPVDDLACRVITTLMPRVSADHDIREAVKSRANDQATRLDPPIALTRRDATPLDAKNAQSIARHRLDR
jgi:hypothetical protein